MTDIEKLYKRVYELEVFKKGSFTLSSGKKATIILTEGLISLDPSGSEKLVKYLLIKLILKLIKLVGLQLLLFPLYHR